MKTDRELTELAAKAVGICMHPADKLNKSYGNWGCDTTCQVCGKDPSDAPFAPLLSNADAFVLLVKLGYRDDIGTALFLPDKDDGTAVVQGFQIHVTEELVTDAYANTRRAITTAAAKVGETML